jgi:cell division protein FtsL
VVLPAPINWNYVFVNSDFNKNKTIYLTVICLVVVYLLLVIYARHKDRKDIEKVRDDRRREKRTCICVVVGSDIVDRQL